MISTRFLSVVCALVGLTLVPTLIHSYAETEVRDGLSTQVISTSLAGYQGVPSGRNATWGKRRFDSDDWTERNYTSQGDTVKLTVVRSFDPKSLYHHPELAIAYGPSYVRSEVKRFAQRPEIPVYVLYTDKDGGTVAMYALEYDRAFVEDPIRFQIRTAGELLFSRRKPMTIFFVTDGNVPASADIDSLPAAKVLVAAIDSFLGKGGSETH
jgi:hypothetical protein